MWALLAVLALVSAGLTTVAVGPAEAAVTTPFAKMYSANVSGDIQIRGNTVMSCQTDATKCAAARNATLTSNDQNNNNYFMSYVDVDDNPTTFDSSSATVALPTGATVLYAALSWGGSTYAGTTVSAPAYGTGTPAAAPTPSAAGQVKLKVPASATYQSVASTRTTFFAGSAGSYQGYADVTSVVAAAGNGSYTVADLQTGTGGGQFGGWSLTIAYGNPADPPRNLTIFAGYGKVGATDTVDLPVSGFQTPLTGDVKTTLGAISYEGDAGSTGDQLQLGNTVNDLQNVKDATHPVANTFDAVISDGGVDGSTRNPKYKNQLGYDQATFAIDPAAHYLSNNATSAVIRLTSGVGGETYYPGVVTFATELYAPNLVATKSVAVVAKATGNLQSGIPEPGDTLRYRVTAVNVGADDAVGTVLTDAIPAGTSYVSGSLKVDGVAQTERTGDDVGSYATGPPTVRVNLGVGAGSGTTSASGGKVVIGASTAPVTFDVVVDSGIRDGATIDNKAQFSYLGFLNNLAVAGASNTVTAAAVTHRSALSVVKTADVALVQKGAATKVSYTLTATNAGPYDDPGVTLTDTLPAGAVVDQVTSPGTCTFPGNKVVCAVGPLTNGRSVTVVVRLTLDEAADPATDTATVAGQNTDDDLRDNSASLSTAVNRAPVATDDSATTSAGTATVDVRANDRDQDGDPLTVTPGTNAPAKGSVVVNADQTVTYTADAGTAGADAFSYTVADGRGGTATATVRVTIPNQPPLARPDASSTTPRTPVTVAVLDNDSDPNIPATNQSLVVSAVTQPAGGQGVVATDGTTVTFTPSARFTKGTATFTYRLSDGAGGTDTGTVLVAIAEQAPVASDDTASTDYRTPVTVDVLANDTDDNDDPLTVTAVGGAAHGRATVVGDGVDAKVRYTPDAGWSGVDTLTYTITDGTTSTTARLVITTGNALPTVDDFDVTVDGGTATAVDVLRHTDDPNGDPLVLVGAGRAAHGSVSVDDDGAVVYEPEAGYAGPDAFDYTVSDGRGGSATGRVSVTVRNQPPHATGHSVLVPLNRDVVVDVLVDDTDPNGDPLTVTEVGTPAHGTATFTAAGAVTYTPDRGYLGDDSFSYAISDGHGGTDTATVAVVVANQAPVAADDTATAGGRRGSPIDIDVLSNDHDPNDDPLTVDSVSTPAHGRAEIGENGVVVYHPDADYAGPDVFTYTISDGRGGRSGASIVVDVRNRPPVAADDSASASAGVPTTIDVLDNDSDPDDDELVVGSVDPSSAEGGSIALTADGVRYTSAVGFTGSDSFAYTVSDPRGGTATAVVTVTVSNADPVAPDRTLTAEPGGSRIDLLRRASDPDGQALTVRVGTAAHGAVTVDDAGVATYTAEAGYAGSDAFSYTVDDGNGGTATGTVTITVDGSAPSPTPTSPAPSTPAPSTPEPSTSEPSTSEPSTPEPSTPEPTSAEPTSAEPTSAEPTSAEPTSAAPTSVAPTEVAPTSAEPTSAVPTSVAPTSVAPTSVAPTSVAPSSVAPTGASASASPVVSPTSQATSADPAGVGNGDLARTGGPALGILGLGVVAVGLGLIALRRGRRRGHDRSGPPAAHG